MILDRLRERVSILVRRRLFHFVAGFVAGVLDDADCDACRRRIVEGAIVAARMSLGDVVNAVDAARRDFHPTAREEHLLVMFEEAAARVFEAAGGKRPN